MSKPKSPPADKQRGAVIGHSQASANPYRCPACGHTHVVLEGKWQRRFQKEFLDREERGVVMQEESYVERYTAIVCEKCSTRTEIEPDHVVDLLAENVKLQMVAAEKRGVTVVPNPKLKVM
jgi:DNA-directed RNA polymerase subunit RPC12/RpoP